MDNNVLIGSNSTILPLQICNDTVIVARSVVTKDILIACTYVENEPKLIKN
jgi:acetyltransferase-like isoleucine patch superfamily enzyme